MLKKILYLLGGIFCVVMLIGVISPAPEPKVGEVKHVAREDVLVLTTIPKVAAVVVSTEENTETPLAKVPTPIPSIKETTSSAAPLPVSVSVVSPEYIYYSVVSVIDGDTIKVDMNGKVEILRLIGMDTPETVDPRKPIQCFGVEASNKAKELLSGRKVRIEKDSTQGERDKYDRLLVYVYRDDGLFYDKYMIAQGYAHEYTYNIPYKYQAEFKAAQHEAEAGQKGLWAPGICDAPQPAQLSPPPLPVATNGNYTCSSNVYNCTDFKTQSEAQYVFNLCGGIGHDIHRLDSDKDGVACESLP